MLLKEAKEALEKFADENLTKAKIRKLSKADCQKLLKEKLRVAGRSKSNALNALEEDEEEVERKIKRRADRQLVATLKDARAITGHQYKEDEAAARRALQLQVKLREQHKRDVMLRENINKREDAQSRLDEQSAVRMSRTLDEDVEEVEEMEE